MLGFKLNHVSKRDHRAIYVVMSWWRKSPNQAANARFKIRDRLSRYRDPHRKDTVVSRPPYLNKGNSRNTDETKPQLSICRKELKGLKLNFTVRLWGQSTTLSNRSMWLTVAYFNEVLMNPSFPKPPFKFNGCSTRHGLTITENASLHAQFEYWIMPSHQLLQEVSYVIMCLDLVSRICCVGQS